MLHEKCLISENEIPIFAFTPKKMYLKHKLQKKASKYSIDQQKWYCLFTFCASIEFHSHRDMSVPSPWVNSDYVSFDIRVETVMDNTVLIPVPRKILKKNGL